MKFLNNLENEVFGPTFGCNTHLSPKRQPRRALKSVKKISWYLLCNVKQIIVENFYLICLENFDVEDYSTKVSVLCLDCNVEGIAM